ncbi:MAG: hypothetical protein ACKKMW_00695 [Candidatus Nealsonbacteria bacterium]
MFVKKRNNFKKLKKEGRKQEKDLEMLLLLIENENKEYEIKKEIKKKEAEIVSITSST